MARTLLRRRQRDPDGRMSVVQHLEELRRRLTISALAWVVGGIVAYVLYNPILDVLRAPLDEGGRVGNVVVDKLYVGGIATGFVLRLKVAAIAGFVFAWPVILWQVWRFVTPGLQRRERRWGIGFVVASIVLFAGGALLSYVLLPVGIRFLLGFTVEAGLSPLIQFSEYVNFISLMTLAFGISFEFPLLLVFLGGIGIVTSRMLRDKRRWAFLGAFIIGAVATPSGDPLSQLMLALPLYILFELAILVIRFGMRK